MSKSTHDLWHECEVCRIRRYWHEAGSTTESRDLHPWEDEYVPSWDRMRGRVPVEPYGYVWTRRDALHYLTCDEVGGYTGYLHVPCSRYGRTDDECAPVAWRTAYLTFREGADPITRDTLDHMMSLVVNDHEDVAYIVREYGRGWYGR